MPNTEAQDNQAGWWQHIADNGMTRKPASAKGFRCALYAASAAIADAACVNGTPPAQREMLERVEFKELSDFMNSTAFRNAAKADQLYLGLDDDDLIEPNLVRQNWLGPDVLQYLIEKRHRNQYAIVFLGPISFNITADVKNRKLLFLHLENEHYEAFVHPESYFETPKRRNRRNAVPKAVEQDNAAPKAVGQDNAAPKAVEQDNAAPKIKMPGSWISDDQSIDSSSEDEQADSKSDTAVKPEAEEDEHSEAKSDNAVEPEAEEDEHSEAKSDTARHYESEDDDGDEHSSDGDSAHDVEIELEYPRDALQFHGHDSTKELSNGDDDHAAPSIDNAEPSEEVSEDFDYPIDDDADALPTSRIPVRQPVQSDQSQNAPSAATADQAETGDQASSSANPFSDVDFVPTYEEAIANLDALHDQARLVRLQRVSRNARDKINGRQHTCAAQIMIETNVYHPESENVVLNACIWDSALGACLRLSLYINRGRKNVHVAHFDFPLNRIFPGIKTKSGNYTYKYSKLGFSAPNVTKVKGEDAYELRFTSECGVVTNAFPSIMSKITEEELEDHEKHIINHLIAICSSESRHEIVLHLSEYSQKDKDVNSAALDDLVKFLTKPPKEAVSGVLWPYAYSTGSLKVQYGNMRLPKELLKKGHQWLPVSRIMRYPDYRVASVVLGYHSQTKYDEEVSTAKALSRDEHNVKIYSMHGTDALVLAVTYSGAAKGKGDKLPFVPHPGSRVRVTIHFDKTTSVTVSAMVPPVPFNVKCSVSLAVLTQSNNADLLYKHAVNFRSKADPMSYKCTINISQSDTMVKQQVNAVSKAYDPEKGVRRLLPSLIPDPLNKSCLRPLSDSFSTNEEKQKFHFAYERWIKDPSNDFTIEQRRALRAFNKVEGGGIIVMLDGPGGTGKSHVMLSLMKFLTENFGEQFKFVLTSRTHEVIDSLVVSFKQKHCASANVLRTASPSKTGLRNFSSDHGSLFDEDAIDHEDMTPAEVMQFNSLVEFVKRNLVNGRGLPDLTVEGQIATLIASKTSVIGKYETKDDTGKMVSTRESLDMTVELGGMIERLHLVPLKEQDAFGNDLWTSEQRRNFKQAFRILVDYVARKSRVIFGTCQSLSARSFRAFGEDAKAIVYIVDEAPSISEPDTLVPLAAYYGSKVRLVCLAGDHEQLGPMNFSTLHCDPFEQQGDVSLSHRLHVCETPRESLNEQRRIHPLVLGPCNKLFYNDKLKAVGEHPELPPRFEEHMKSYLNWGEDVKLSEQQQRIGWFEVNGDVRKSSSGSKSNYENHYFIHDTMFPLLKAIYGSEVHSKCAIMTPYADEKIQLNLMKREACTRSENPFTLQELPQIWTVDEAQGKEMDHIILDTVITHADEVGFMSNKGRVCVATTRAREVLWVVGGAMGQDHNNKDTTKEMDIGEAAIDPQDPKSSTALFTYKGLLRRLDCVHTIDDVRRPILAELPTDLILTLAQRKESQPRADFDTEQEYRDYVLKFAEEQQQEKEAEKKLDEEMGATKGESSDWTTAAAADSSWDKSTAEESAWDKPAAEESAWDNTTANETAFGATIAKDEW